jgi:aminopeptidase N/uncharacterized membrane protein (UPF0127 family)
VDAPLITPVHYRLALDPHAQAHSFSGEVAITLILDRAATELRLDCEDLQIDSAAIDGRPVPSRIEPGVLILDPVSPLQSGKAVIEIRFRGGLATFPCGFYLGEGFVATQLQPTHARRVFPCFDDPRWRTVFEVSAWVPAGQTAISNAAILHEDPGSGRRCVTFAPSPAIPTHLLALAIGPFERLSHDDEHPLLSLYALHAPERCRIALETARKALAFYGDWLARPYPFDKLDLVVLPGTGVAGMENTGAIFLRETAVALADSASPKARREAATLVAHEVAHQWFGGVVTPSDWRDLWLNEGFATWMAPKALAAIAPALARDIDEVRAFRMALHGDVGPGARPLIKGGASHREIEELFDAIAYRKGAALLRMLESWLGEAAFRRALRLYLDGHANGTATSDDLWRALEQACGKPAAALAQSFATRAGAPHLAIQWASDTVEVMQLGAELSTVPVRLRVALDSGEEEVISLLLEGPVARTTLPAPIRWAFGDAGAFGYYRCSYPDSYPPFSGLSPPEAVVLLEDAWLSLWNSETDLLVYLTLAREALAEGAAIPSLRDHLRELRDLLAAGGRAPLFDAWIAGLGIAGSSDEIRLLLGEAGHTGVLAEATQVARAWLTAAQVPDERLETSLAIAARQGDAALFDAMRAALRRGPEAEPLTAALCAFRDPARLGQQLALLEDPILDQPTRVLAAEALLVNPATRDPCWALLKERWENLGPPLIGLGGRGVVTGLAAFADPAVGTDIARFFAGRQVPGAERMLRATLGRIAGRGNFRESHQAVMDAFLLRLGAPAGPPPARLSDELALLAGLAAGFRGALLQRGLFDRFGLPTPPWMHTSENLRGALGTAERQLARLHRGAPVVSSGDIALTQRLREDLLAAADQLARLLERLPDDVGREGFLKVAAGFARAGAMIERNLEAAIVFTALFGPEPADGLRRECAETRLAFASARAWIAEPPAGEPTPLQRLTLQNEAVLTPGLLRLHAERLQAHLAAIGVGEAPDASSAWAVFGFDARAVQAWRAAGFDDPQSAANWRLRMFDPTTARRHAAEGADPAALRSRPTAPAAALSLLLVSLPDGTVFTVEIANDPATRAQGLVHRDGLPPRGGMLFVHADERPRPISMRHVRIPLDVFWLDADGCVLHSEIDVPAWHEGPVPADPDSSRCRYVLELPAGTALRHRLEIGARFVFAIP